MLIMLSEHYLWLEYLQQHKVVDKETLIEITKNMKKQYFPESYGDRNLSISGR